MIKREALPPVTISTGDYDRLAFLASFGLNFEQDRPAAAMLANELLRATVVTPCAMRHAAIRGHDALAAGVPR
jgi:regulator of nucleoside diphosphate kinase